MYRNCSNKSMTVSGAKVIVACRDVKKGEQAVSDILKDVKGDNLGQLIVEELDLASFVSIKQCAKRILQKEKKIHLLVNNAGECITRIRVFLKEHICRHCCRFSSKKYKKFGHLTVKNS